MKAIYFWFIIYIAIPWLLIIWAILLTSTKKNSCIKSCYPAILKNIFSFHFLKYHYLLLVILFLFCENFYSFTILSYFIDPQNYPKQSSKIISIWKVYLVLLDLL